MLWVNFLYTKSLPTVLFKPLPDLRLRSPSSSILPFRVPYKGQAPRFSRSSSAVPLGNEENAVSCVSAGGLWWDREANCFTHWHSVHVTWAPRVPGELHLATCTWYSSWEMPAALAGQFTLLGYLQNQWKRTENQNAHCQKLWTLITMHTWNTLYI